MREKLTMKDNVQQFKQFKLKVLTVHLLNINKVKHINKPMDLVHLCLQSDMVVPKVKDKVNMVNQATWSILHKVMVKCITHHKDIQTHRMANKAKSISNVSLTCRDSAQY